MNSEIKVENSTAATSVAAAETQAQCEQELPVLTQSHVQDEHDYCSMKNEPIEIVSCDNPIKIELDENALTMSKEENESQDFITKCPVCFEIVEANLLRNHVLTRHHDFDGQIYRSTMYFVCLANSKSCLVCDEEFLAVDSHLEHFACQFCSFLTVSKEKICAHYWQKHRFCVLCQEVVNENFLAHLDPNCVHFKCVFCNFYTMDRSRFCSHIINKHQCKTKNKVTSNLLMYTFLPHENQVRCDICNDQIELSAGSAGKNEHFIHYKCQFCDFCTIKKAKLQLHKCRAKTTIKLKLPAPRGPSSQPSSRLKKDNLEFDDHELDQIIQIVNVSKKRQNSQA